MVILKNIAILLVVSLFIHMAVSGPAIAQQNWYAKAKITKHKPVLKAPPEEDIPVETIQKKGGGKWIWALLGVAAIAGGAAAVSGNDDSNSSSSKKDEGNVSVSW